MAAPMKFKVAYKLYKKAGQTAVEDAVKAGLLGTTEWLPCEPCEDTEPHSDWDGGKVCLVCWTVNRE
jgi:hypothetical protein